MIKKVLIKNYRVFEDFQLDLTPGLNMIVGDNDTGKSTLLEAIHLALTGTLHGFPLSHELSPYLLNQAVVLRYLDEVARGRRPSPPEFFIEIYLSSEGRCAELVGENNSLREEAAGIRLRCVLDDDYSEEYEEYLRNKPVRFLPIEYYKVEWLDFSGNPIPKKKPVVASLIDASTIHLQSGTDSYLKGIISGNLESKERAGLALAYRRLRETFSTNPTVTELNERLVGAPGEISSRPVSLSIDISKRSTWERALVPHLDDLPLQYVGKGEQSSVKILMALHNKLTDCHVVLVEEPENHLSFSSLTALLAKIEKKCQGIQVLITTHSSYVLNKLGLGSLVLLSHAGGVRMAQLPVDTVDYFKKLSGYDTLRLVLARRAILVEGPSDELIIQRAYKDTHGCLPISHGADVINVRGLSAKRFLDIAVLLGKKVAVVNDNDGDEQKMRNQYSDYAGHAFVSVHVGTNDAIKTLEPQILAANDRDILNKIFGTSYDTNDDLLKYMLGNKTNCAVAILEADEKINMPKYIRDAVA